MRARWTCAALAGSALALCPSFAAAAELNLAPRPYIVAINLLFVLLLLWPVNRLLIAPLVRVLKERESRTRGSNQAAAELRAEIGTELARLEAARNGSRRQAAERRTAILALGKGEEQNLLEAARAEASASLAGVRETIAGELEQARAGLRSESRALARLAAERILGRSL